MHLNLQGGFLSKSFDLELFLENSNVNIICLNEHWLSKDQIFQLNKIPTYKLATYFCRKDGQRGGSCILIKESLNFIERLDLSTSAEENVFEISCLEIPVKNLIVVSLYRVPVESNFSKFMTKLEILFEKLQTERKNKGIYIAADFNIDVLNSSKVLNKDKQKFDFIGLVEAYGFSVCFSEPTRISKNSSTCIDNILINKSFENVQPELINLDLSMSDHRALFISLESFCRNRKFSGKITLKKRIFSDKSLKHFFEELSMVQWSFLTCNNAQENFKLFFNQFFEIFNVFFPSKFYSNSNRKRQLKNGWVTEGIRISSATKRRLHQLVKLSQNKKLINYYKIYKKIFKVVCKEAKKSYNCKLIKTSENKTKTAWDIIKSEMGVKTQIQNITSIDIDGTNVSEGQQIANHFNKYFLNVTKDLKIAPQTKEALSFIRVNKCSSHEFSFQHVSSSDVFKTIQSLKSKMSAGWDGLPVSVMKIVASSVSNPLCKVINQCFDEGWFPSQLKYAEVKPLHKKGNKEFCLNYRPVSILTSFSKVFEKTAYNQITDYLEKNKIFSSEQFGFRSGHSTNLAISQLVNKIVHNLDSSKSTAAFFCDLSKAFDCVTYNILLEKLKIYKFSKKALLWLTSYISNRSQRTVILKDNKKYISSWQKIACGVPQGSILGPLLFLIYINDLPYNIGSSIILYADDTTSVLETKTDEDLVTKLQENLQQLSKWFKANGLSINNSKSQIVKFHTAHNKKGFNPTTLNWKGLNLNFSDTASFLGVIVDSKLSWKPYIETLKRKLNSSCYQIISIRHTTDIKTRLLIYYANFYSLVYYGIEFWGKSVNAIDIFKIQKRYIRLMTFSKRDSSCKDIFQQLQILTVPSMYILKCLIIIKSNIQSILDSQYHHKYKTSSAYKGNLQYPRHRLSLFENTQKYMGIKFYNKLPIAVREINDIKHFKKIVKDLLLAKTYYSVQDFLNDDV